MSGDRPLVAHAPRLTRLELHCFKSFATRTVFAFEPGITAIVGPNGSGKSNVADAVRWVLGEQGQTALRARRTEDVIFAGGQGRAPAGLAEATLTFDNADRWLPIDFAEVTVTRRAFRSGENHYLINGRRVRLKDVAHLTASLGQSHVVVGQGLVDAALSLRAEERRGLFEHAADLAGLRLKVAEAERNLAETEVNSTRLTDLLTQLEPRLKTLERAARQAREWQGVRDRLRELQREHFGRLLATARRAQAGAVALAEQRAAELAAARATADRLAAEGEALARSVEAARAALTAHDRRRQTLADRLRRVEHERDLTAERAAALERRRDDMADTQAGLEEQGAAVAAELARLARELAALVATTAAAGDEVATCRAGVTAERARHAELERRATALATHRGDSERRATELVRRRALLDQRRDTDAAERERMLPVVSERSARIERLAAELDAATCGTRADEEELGAIEARLAALADEVDQAAKGMDAAVTALADVERRLGQATTRLDVLRRLHESGHGGVWETVTAARAGTLGGVVGTVAELIAVPAELDTAIEVALGGRLQDVVVERWVDAEAAIAHLRRTNAGRATFQPLDTVRRGRGGGKRPLASGRVQEAMRLAGSRGIAADLVGAEPALRGVVDGLLGRTLVVTDLATARAALPLLPTGWSAVTLAGELARSGGSVTGGAAVRESGVLGRERELRELPAAIRRQERERDRALAARAVAEEEAHRPAEARRAGEAARAAQLAAADERRRQRERLATWLAELRAEQAAAEGRLEAIAAGESMIAAELAALAAEDADLGAAIADATAAEKRLRAELDRVTQAVAAGEHAAGEAGQRLAALDERLRAERRREAGLRNQERALAEELALRGGRTATLEQERMALAESHRRLVHEAATLEQEWAELGAAREPLEADARRAEMAVTRSARSLAAARDGLLECERAHGASELAVDRADGELAALRRRFAEELDQEDPDAPFAGQVDAEGGEGEEALAVREREIARLKDRLRRVGYVGEDAVAEFEREATHHAFLRGQLADVQGAATSLRTLLGDLQSTMRARFDETFARVAAAFAESFAVLFGGGAARLVLVGGEEGEDGSRSQPGVDIVAQPPGKRPQSLALLSGGERALTAAALLFAILRVNPAPFCLLDEVDAALDEANVVRFRDQLRTLAGRTQVIIVTHNRGTIETADTLYGVTMSDEGVSEVLSLRLNEGTGDRGQVGHPERSDGSRATGAGTRDASQAQQDEVYLPPVPYVTKTVCT